MAARGDGIRLSSEGVRLASAEARARLAEALGAALALGRGAAVAAPRTVVAPRPSPSPPYVLTLRPVFDLEASETAGAAAVLFVHDPGIPPLRATDTDVLRLLFDLTAAEARLAQALMEGRSPIDHARDSGTSINTAYTHLRRLKDKTGARRLPELIHRLSEAVPGPAFAGSVDRPANV
jgi:DNA-binding CsgD family transcriptional regulator